MSNYKNLHLGICICNCIIVFSPIPNNLLVYSFIYWSNSEIIIQRIWSLTTFAPISRSASSLLVSVTSPTGMSHPCAGTAPESSSRRNAPVWTPTADWPHRSRCRTTECRPVRRCRTNHRPGCPKLEQTNMFKNTDKYDTKNTMQHSHRKFHSSMRPTSRHKSCSPARVLRARWPRCTGHDSGWAAAPLASHCCERSANEMSHVSTFIRLFDRVLLTFKFEYPQPAKLQLVLTGRTRRLSSAWSMVLCGNGNAGATCINDASHVSSYVSTHNPNAAAITHPNDGQIVGQRHGVKLRMSVDVRRNGAESSVAWRENV